LELSQKIDSLPNYYPIKKSFNFDPKKKKKEDIVFTDFANLIVFQTQLILFLKVVFQRHLYDISEIKKIKINKSIKKKKKITIVSLFDDVKKYHK